MSDLCSRLGFRAQLFFAASGLELIVERALGFRARVCQFWGLGA